MFTICVYICIRITFLGPNIHFQFIVIRLPIDWFSPLVPLMGPMGCTKPMSWASANKRKLIGNQQTVHKR